MITFVLNCSRTIKDNTCFTSLYLSIIQILDINSKYKITFRTFLVLAFVGMLLTDCISYYWENVHPIEVYELSDFNDFDSEKENNENKEDIDDKIPLESLYTIFESSDLHSKNLLSKIFQHLHHPEINTPPPEFLRFSS